MPDTPITFDDVEVLSATDMALRCRIRGKVVTLGRLQVMQGTTVTRIGDRGRVVIPRWVAQELGLPEPLD